MGMQYVLHILSSIHFYNLGLCECVGNNWAGYLCDQCNDTFYGPDCLPLVKVLEIIPSSGPEKGGYAVHIWGHNFQETVNGTYKCRFGSIETDGKWLTKNHVVCTAPQQSEGEVIVEISTDGTEFTNDKVSFNICPIFNYVFILLVKHQKYTNTYNVHH
jgi:hypothetical protein